MPSTRTKVVFFGAVAAGAVIFACADDPHRRTSREQAIGGGGACEAKPGEVPEANCDNSLKSCASAPGCEIDEAKCGSKSTCLPMADNAGKEVQDFRIRRLNIAAPPALAGSFIQNTVVNLNVDLADKACGELGKNLFSWLFRVDRTAAVLITGGAPPSSDPFGQGFCFANFTLAGQKVEPFTVPIAFEGDTFRSLEERNVKIPIFLSDDLASAVLLPLSGVKIAAATISKDGNCIGQFNPVALDPGCAEDRSLCSKWVTAGSLGGFITLEEADGVNIRELGKTLCAFLSQEPKVCARDGAGRVAYKGDYCGATGEPGGCQDAVWLAATFAASAAKIFDGQGQVEGCSGATTGSADAGSDAPADAPDDG